MLKSNQKVLLNLVLLVLLFLVVIRPIMKRVQDIAKEGKGDGQEPKALPEGEQSGELLGGSMPSPDALSPRARAVALIEHDPERAAKIVRNWLREGEL